VAEEEESGDRSLSTKALWSRCGDVLGSPDIHGLNKL